MSLGDFLTDETLGSWADEMESMPLAPSAAHTGYGERRAFSTTDRYGSGSGFNDRPSFNREQLPLPDKPPFTAHIGNLPFDLTESEVGDFFASCSVTNVRIVEDRVERKPKGFGYVEFATLDGLKRALELNSSQFSGRSIRVSVAEPPKDRGEVREINDWTRKGPLPPLPTDQRRTSDRAFASRNYDNLSDAGSDRGERRRPFEQGDGKVRDFSNWERKGPLSPLTPSGSTAGDFSRPRTREGPREGQREGPRDGPRDRRTSPAWGEARSQDGSRPPRKEFQEKPSTDRAPSAADMDSQWRARMRPDAPSKSSTPPQEKSDPPSPAAPSAAPATRPRLQLQKRTVSEHETTSPSGSTAASDSKPSPFGGARPIDTFAREKEIEERRQLALRQKREQDEKKRAASKAATRDQRAAAPVEEAKAKENGDAQASTPTATPVGTASNFALLNRVHDKENGAQVQQADQEDEHKGEKSKTEGENGRIVDDKEVKPREIVREMPSERNKDAGNSSGVERKTADSATTSADALEEDGWSTVSKVRNNRRGGSQAARAIAS